MESKTDKEPNYIIWVIILSIIPLSILFVTEVLGDQMLRKALMGEEATQLNSTSKP